MKFYFNLSFFIIILKNKGKEFFVLNKQFCLTYNIYINHKFYYILKKKRFQIRIKICFFIYQKRNVHFFIYIFFILYQIILQSVEYFIHLLLFFYFK